jgi:hypothetical protein
MFCFVSRVLYTKSVNAIPSSCMYKLFQSSNYEIGDYFYDEAIAQNHAFKLQWNFHKCLDYNCNTFVMTLALGS